MQSVHALTSAQLAAVERGMQALQRGDVAAAQSVADALLAQGCLAADVHHLAALCHAQRGFDEAAERAFEAALAASPDHVLARVNYGAWLRRRKAIDRAFVHLQCSVGLSPGFARAWSELGALQIQRCEYVDAIGALRHATALDANAVNAWHLLGNAYRAIDDLSGAEKAFRRVIALSPGHPTATLNLASVLRLSGRADEAVHCLKPAIGVEIDGPEWLDTYAGALLDSGNVEAALEAGRRLVTRFPAFARGYATHANLVMEYTETGTPESALAPLRAAVLDRPLDASLRCEYARLLLATGQAEAALVQLRTLENRHGAAWLVRLEADALTRLGRGLEAAALFEKAWSHIPADNVELLKGHARHLLMLGAPDRAAEMLERATKMMPADQEGWAYLGTAWCLLGDSRESWLCDEGRLVGELEVACPSGYPSFSGFLEEVRATLDGLHRAQREPVSQSVKGGSQTPGRLFGRRHPVLQALHSALSESIQAWLAGLSDDATHPFLSRNTRRARITGSWSVRLHSSGRHESHMHPEGWLSSAFYVAVPRAVQSSDVARGGWLEFGVPPDELGLSLAPRRQVCPAPGKLVLFPSYLWHGTVPFHDVQPRMTVAFDAVPVAHG